jgi:MinD-like ATPase involved in chromosome partitioning or flagellar assembly
VSTVAFFSAKGAPGATTAAMLVASLWPRPALLVDADPAGGDIALRLPSPEGRPLDQSTGMLSLLPLARRAITGEQVLAHAQRVLGGGEVIAGLSGPEQATAAGPVWAALIDVLRDVDDRDVMIDLGRLSVGSAVLPMAARADLAVLVTRDTVSGVVAARARLRALVPALTDAQGAGPQLGLIVQGDSDREANSAASVIRGEFPRVQDYGRLAWDPVGVRMFDGEHVGRPERSLIVRSGREIVTAVDGALYGIELLRNERRGEKQEPR